MVRARAAALLLLGVAVALVALSGGRSSDPRTPAGPAGKPPPFLGVAVLGGGELTAAVDAYGDVVDLRPDGPGGPASIALPAAVQEAESVPAETGIRPMVSIAGRPAMPFWQADSVSQRHRPGTNVLVTAARFGSTRATVVYAAAGPALACLTRAGRDAEISIANADPDAAAPLRCDDDAARRIVARSENADRRWLSEARPLGPAAPPWAGRMYERALLTLRALTDRRSGAAVAGAREGWAYVWPRDAGTTALALAAAGYRPEARRVARFLLGLDLGAAARFHGDGAPVPGRGAQGDAGGWVAVAARAAGLPAPPERLPWRDRPDYQERSAATYLANAISQLRVDRIEGEFETGRGLVREEGDPESGLDSAAAWAVRPFAAPALFPAARRTLLRLTAQRGRFGLLPSEDWDGIDPWMAPAAWSAWSLAALGERGRALALLGDLRRAATPAGDLPERVDAGTGIPRSTTPLAWPHAFAILALRELWPGDRGGERFLFP